MESNKSDLESFCGVIRTQKDTVFFLIWCGIKGESDFDHSVHLDHHVLSFSKIPHQTEI
jgi:hypothetical protein